MLAAWASKSGLKGMEPDSNNSRSARRSCQSLALRLIKLYARLYSMQFRDPEEELAALKAAMSPSDVQRDGAKSPEKPADILDVILGRGYPSKAPNN